MSVSFYGLLEARYGLADHPEAVHDSMQDLEVHAFGQILDLQENPDMAMESLNYFASEFRHSPPLCVDVIRNHLQYYFCMIGYAGDHSRRSGLPSSVINIRIFS